MSFNHYVLPGGAGPQANFMRQMVPGMPMQVTQFPQQVRPVGDYNPVPQFHFQPQAQFPHQFQYQHPVQQYPFMQFQQQLQQIQPPVAHAEVYEPQQPLPTVQQQQPLTQPPVVSQSSSSLQDFNQSIVRKSIEILCQCKKPMSATELCQQLGGHIVRLSEKQLIEVLSNYPNNFTIYAKEGTEDYILSVCTKLGLCKEHCSKQGQCPGIPMCDGLHICKFFLLSNSCRVEKQGKNCLFGHDLTSPHNMSLLRQNMLEHLSVHNIKNLFRTTESRGRTTMPSICRFYNINVGCRAQEDGNPCPYLHICKFYVIGQCRFGKRCKRGHDVCDPQVNEILTKYGINTNRSPKEILQEIRNVEFDVFDDASSQTSAHTDSKDPYRAGVDSDIEDPSELDESSLSPDDPPADICIFHMRGRCAFGKSCRKSHKGTTYQWQYRKKGLNQWDDFQRDHNFEVEGNFSDVTRSECYIKTDSGVLKLNFDTMEAVLQEQNQIVVQMFIRRLSTPSSEVEKFQPLATVWKWFWQNNDGSWEEYGQSNYPASRYQSSVDSSSMEQNFLKNPTGQLHFNTMGYNYVMDFEQLLQQNVENGTERKVRRRPVFVDEKEMERNKKKAPEAGSQTGKVVSMVTGPALIRPMQNYIPAEWEIHQIRMGGQQHVIEHFQRTVITGDNTPRIAEEVKKIKELFYQTMSPNQYITCIERVENGELWMNYVSKREKMSMKKRSDDLNEKRLFHGTSNKYIDAICRQGFDFRFSGQSTGTKYGKGSYFTKSAKFADSYTDRNRDKEMFLVRVIAGDVTLGHSSMVRPPHKSPSNPFDLFDSCVDDMKDPNIFVIFTFDQAYPEYVIKYRS